MLTENIYLSSGNTHFLETSSEKTASGNTVVKTLLVSVLDHKNENGVLIANKEGKKYHKTLVNKPVQAFLKYDEDGRPANFGGHELKRKLDADGEPMYYFATQSIGTHTDSRIETLNLPAYGGEVECIVADVELWTSRYPEYYEVAEELIASGKLASSWEISTQKYEYANGEKKLIEFEFIGNAFLGSDVAPAVTGAGVMTSEDEKMLRTAFERDLLVASQAVKEGGSELEEEEKVIEAEIIEPVIEAEVVEPVVEAEPEIAEPVIEKEVIDEEKEADVEPIVSEDEVEPIVPEIASLTISDIERKINIAITPAVLSENGLSESVNWIYWATRIYPEEHRAIAGFYGEGTTDDTSFVEIMYAVEGNEVSIVSVKKAEMQFIASSVVSEKDVKITELSEKLIEVSTKLIGKETEIAELSEVKIKYDEIVKAENEAKKLLEIAEFKNTYLATKLISESDFEDNEAIKIATENLDKNAMKLIIADIVMSGVKVPDVASVETEKKKLVVEEKLDISSFLGFVREADGSSISKLIHN